MREQSSDRPERTLHLIDADNLLGDPTTTDRLLITAMFEEYRRVASYASSDQVVVASGVNGWHVFEVERAWPNVCHRRRAGVDGADLELLAEAEWAAISHRFDRVVIGSGDGIFAEAVDLLAAAGVRVEVVSRHRALASCLAARRPECVRPLTDPRLLVGRARVRNPVAPGRCEAPPSARR